jgi:AraC-like DNA-binding protein
MIDISRNLALIYVTQGYIERFETAMRNERALRDSLFTGQRQMAIQELQIRYETRQQNLLIAQQKERLQFMYTGFALFIAVILLLICVYFLQRRKMQNIIRIVQQHEALAKYEKENVLRQPESSEKILSDLQRLFEEEKMYRQQGLSNNEVCEALGTNRIYLSKVLNNNFRMNFPEYVNDYRVKEAKELLKGQSEGNEYASYTIQAISKMVGFNSTSSFYDAFKQIVGVTPSEYKKAIKSSSIPPPI